MPYKNEEDKQRNYLEHYFKKFGHYPKPLVRKTKEEKAETKKAWNKANIDKNKSYAKKSRLKHKKQRALDCKNWVENNREYCKKYHKKYNKKWYQENKVSNDERSKKWVKNNPGRIFKTYRKNT